MTAGTPALGWIVDGQYVIQHLLGQGGHASVYLAHDSSTGAAVAVKLVALSRDILPAETRGAELQRRFAEQYALVPKVLATATWQGWFYIVMEYVEGEDLAHLIARGPQPAGVAVDYAVQLAAFLERAHRFKTTIDGRSIDRIVHGDLKPENVRLPRAGGVRVLDFGIAKAMAEASLKTTNQWGTRPYLSPERLKTGQVDEHVDYWSLGVMLFELLAGYRPYQAFETNPSRLEEAICDATRPAALPDDCPPRLREIVLKLLAPELTRRYASAAEIKEDLDAFRANQPTKAQAQFARASVPTERVPGGSRRSAPTDPMPVAPSPAAESVSVPGTTRRVSRARTLGPALRALAVAGVLGLAISEGVAGLSAEQLRRLVVTANAGDMKTVLDRYDALERRCALDLGLRLRVNRPLRRRLLELAEPVIADYRQDLPAVRQRQWQEARAFLLRALAIDPHDVVVRANLAYSEAHDSRIIGQARKQLRDFVGAQQHLHNAVQKFREAARLRPEWADPFLGVARAYGVAGLDDVDEVEQAIAEAITRGYPMGRRERAQLADGLQSRADRLRREALQLEGSAQEGALRRASADYERAIELFEALIGFANASGNLTICRRRFGEVRALLAQFEPPTSLAFPPDPRPKDDDHAHRR